MNKRELFKSNALLLRDADKILKYNETTQDYQLTLTQKQAIMLVKTRSEELKYHGRLEFGEGALGKLIEAFCDSPYINRQNYFDTLCALTEIFYYYKNETELYLSDNGLIEYMKRFFNGSCKGSLDLLSTREMDELVRNLRR